MRTEATIRVLFMGTPDFAAPSLRALTEQANAGPIGGWRRHPAR